MRSPRPTRFFILAVTPLLVATAGVAASTDWPMLACNVRRHGATPEEIKPPFRRKWYRNFADEGIVQGNQPVVAGGRAYIGTMRGVLHAIDDATGRDVWTYKVPYGIFHAAAVAEGAVYVCGGDGCLHAVDARTGRRRWVFDPGTDVALWNSPLPFDGKVYFGGRDGFVYAVNARDGGLAWKAEVGAPIVHSPAVDPGTKRLYIGADDMHAYAFDARTGRRLWRSEKLQGFSFTGYYPVVVPEGGIVFTTRCVSLGTHLGGVLGFAPLGEIARRLYGAARSDKSGYGNTEFPALPSWVFTKEQNQRFRSSMYAKWEEPDFWKRQSDLVREQLSRAPHWQNTFLLDGATGRSRGVVPVLPGDACCGTRHPPVVMRDGKVVLPVAIAGPDCFTFGTMDPRTGGVELLKRPTAANPRGARLPYLGDCTNTISAAGPILVQGRIVAAYKVLGYDTSAGRHAGGAWAQNVHRPDEMEREVQECMPLRLLRGEALPLGFEYVRRGLGVYGGGPGLESPIAVAGRSFYYFQQHETCTGGVLCAYETTDGATRLTEPVKTAPISEEDRKKLIESDFDFDMMSILGPRRRVDPRGTIFGVKIPGTPGGPDPAGLGAGGRPSDAELERILFEAGASAVAADAAPKLRAKLAAAVEELVGNDWAVLAFPGRSPRWVYSDPSEVFYALGLAWPYLSGRLREKAGAYARARWAKADPLSVGFLGTGASERRERYEFKPGRSFHCRTRRPGLGRLYPVWCYAHASGDWSGLENGWGRLKGALGSARPGAWKEDGRNGYLSGLIAYCRIAAHMRDRDALDAARPKAIAAMRERIEYEAAMTRGGVYYEHSSTHGAADWHDFAGPARWFFLTPETGRLCRAFAPKVQETLLARYVDHHRPTWYLAWGPLICFGGERSDELPLHAISHFQAKAFLVETPPEELAHAVDIPWCKADLYYIEKLALAIRARGKITWRDVRR